MLTKEPVDTGFAGCKMSRTGQNVRKFSSNILDIILKFSGILPRFPHFSLRQTQCQQALDLRPSKRLIAFYTFIYGFTLIAIFANATTWPKFILGIVLSSVSIAGIFSVLQCCALKKIICLAPGKMELHFKSSIKTYDKIKIRHQGPTLIVLHVYQDKIQDSFVFFQDSFSEVHFAALQRFLKVVNYRHESKRAMILLKRANRKRYPLG